MANQTYPLGSLDLPTFSRVDIVVAENQIKVIEVNCDSPAGIVHLDAIADFYRHELDAWVGDAFWLHLPAPHTGMNALKDAFYRRWRQFNNQAELRPHEELPNSVAIVDRNPMGQAAYSEFESLQASFAQDLGRDRVVICTPKDLSYGARRRLIHTPTGLEVDLVYKRILWRDLVDIDSDAVPLINAYRDWRVCVLNSFRSRLAGSKRLLGLIQSRNGCTCTEENYVDFAPYFAETHYFGKDRSLLERALDEPEKYVVKSCRGHGAEYVFMSSGKNPARAEQLRRAFAECDKTPCVLQKVCRHGTVRVPVIDETRVKSEILEFVVGAYVVCGICVALEARAGERPVSMTYPSQAYRTIVLPLIDSA